MLAFENVTLRAGDFHLSADWVLPDAQITALIGPSGGGKSTLLSAIAGFVLPSVGQVTWQGRDLAPVPPGQRPVAMLFQDNNLFSHLTVAQNIGLALRPNLRLSTAELAQVDAALAQVDLAGLGARKPAQLSGGQQSRAALARVLLMRRPVILLDEPFAALGPRLRQEMLGLTQLLAKAQRASLVMVTHDPNDTKQIADYVVLVAGNVASKPVPTAAIFADPPQALRDYLGSTQNQTP